MSDNGEQVKAMIDKQSSEFNWKFTYIGANQDAFKAAAKIGIGAAATLHYSTANTTGTFDALSANTTRARGSAINGKSVDMSYTSHEREAAAK